MCCPPPLSRPPQGATHATVYAPYRSKDILGGHQAVLKHGDARQSSFKTARTPATSLAAAATTGGLSGNLLKGGGQKEGRGGKMEGGAAMLQESQAVCGEDGGGGGVDEEWCDDEGELRVARQQEEDEFVREEDPLDTAWGDVW